MNKLSRRLQMPEGDGGAGGGASNSPVFTYGDAHKEYVTGKGWKGVDDVITSNQNLEKLLGADKAGRGFIWPKDEADTEGIKALHAKLGVPESADKYELPLPAGATEPDPFLKAIAGELHKNGVPKVAAQAIAKFVNEYDANAVKESETAQKQQADQALAALKTEWGTAHEANTGLAVTLMSEMGFTQEEITAMKGSAELLKKFHAGASKLGAKSMVQGDGGSGGMSQMAAREKLEAKRAERSQGKISERDWLEISEKLSPIAYPAQAA